MGYGIGTSSSGGGSGGGGSGQIYTPEPIGGPGGGGYEQEQPRQEVGKGSISLTDPAGSIGESLGSIANFGSGLLGGVAGAIGSLGPDKETASIGQLAEDLGRVPGGIGDIQLPYVGEGAQAATLSQLPGAMFEPVYQLQRGVQKRVAEARSLDYLKGDTTGLPPDLQARLDAGESVDVVAKELLARGQAFSSNQAEQFAGEVVFDPLNLIAPGAGKAIQAAKEASYAVRAADDLSKLGLTQRSVGTIYNIATNGGSKGLGAVMDKVIGPTTSGVFHALGSRPYLSLLSGAAKLSPDYGENFRRAFDLGAGQLPRAVIGREMMEDVRSGLQPLVNDVSRTVERRLGVKSPRELERRAEELLGRTTPDFYGATPESMFAETAAKYAAITGMSVEDAGRILGSRVSRQTARTVHLAYYGHAGGELADIKNVLKGQDVGLDTDRLTVIAHDTLTDELADEIGKNISVADAVDRFSVLGNHFIGKNASDSDVLEFIAKLRGSLPEAVKLPKSGKNKLPDALSDWRVRNQEFGYELGFAPKDGWKAIVDENGDVIASDPFVHFVSDVSPTNLANPLGRFADYLMRGKTQTVIVQESRQRMTDFIVRDAKLPIAPNQVRSIHKAILEEAADRKLTPRGMSAEHTEGGTLYDAIFRRFLSPSEYKALTEQYDTTYLVMKAFEGNLDTVGLTQKVTGAVKTVSTEGYVPGGANIARIAENLYPRARFTFRPTFQAQEVIESPTFNALRGVTDREVPEELATAYAALAEQPEFRFLTEANFLNIAGDRAVTKFMGKNTPYGRAMGRFTNIQARKETARVRQVMFEHGEDFKNAVNGINPKFWKAMEEAYGTTDARVVADRFLAERLALSSGNIDDVTRLVDEATDALKSTLDDAVIRTGQEAASQAANVEVGVLNGGTKASGGAVRAEGALPTSASDQVLQAFKDSMRQASNRAFQTHFFNPQRGWLERSLNHPYLALYPLSYMWGKVLPEFARFLFTRPFGKNVPLLPAVQLARVQQAYVGALADNPDFRKFMEDHEEAIYFANLLFPGNPVNLTVNAPAYARHIIEDAQAGRKVDSTTITREITDSTNYAFGLAHDLTSVNKAGADIVDISQDIFAMLEKAARQYDGMFPSSGRPRP
jgi:hypothetical protein